MKLSIAWIFDHIEADWQKVDMQHLVTLFNQKVAEIEGYQKVHTDLTPVSLVEITRLDTDAIIAYSKEWQQECILPLRKSVTVGQYFLVKKNDIFKRLLNRAKDRSLTALNENNFDKLEKIFKKLLKIKV